MTDTRETPSDSDKGKALVTDQRETPTGVDKGKTPMIVTSTEASNESIKEKPVRDLTVRYGTQSVGTPNLTKLLNHVTSIKLDETNFLLWQNIVLPILRSYKLEGHLSGKTPAPEMSIILPPSEDDSDGLLMPNLEYDLWLAADQLLVGWLYNSMLLEITAQVMGHEEAKQLWDSVQEYYGMQSRSQKDYNRLMLQQTQKGTMKMYKYLWI